MLGRHRTTPSDAPPASRRRARHRADGRGWFSTRRRTTKIAATVAAAAIALSSLTILSPATIAEATTPGTPGVAQPGTPVYTEDFSNQSAAGGAISILNYTGSAAAANMKYTADPQYTPAGNQCNGWILGPSTPLPASDSGCTNNQPVGWQQIQQLARELGAAQGQTAAQAATNQALSEYTNNSSGTIAAGTEFKTASSNAIPAVAGHYYAVSAYFAQANCFAAHAKETFSLIINGVPTALSSGLDPCGTYTGAVDQITKLQSAAIQIPVGTTASLGLSLYNATASGSGNDVAFDLPQIVDVTPQIDKSFSPALIAPGQTSTVTLTVTNTADLMAKNDWSITDALPAGLAIAPTPAVGGTCGQVTGAAYVTTAVAGTGTFTATGGDLAAGQTSCTITFNVTAAAEGTYTNGPGNIVSNLNPPANAVLVVRAPRITLTKALGAPREAATDQFTVALKTGGASGSAVASGTTIGTGAAVTAGSGTTGAYVATVGTAYTLTEAASGTTSLANYASTITCTDSFGLQSGLPNGAAYNPASPPSITPVAGANIACVITNTAQPIMSWNKVVDKGAGTVVNPGDTVKYTISVTNAGSVANPSFSAFDDLTNVVNNATFNAGSIVVSPAGTGTATYDATSKHLTWTGPVAANATVSVSYTVTVNAGAFGQLKNAFIDKSVVNPIGASLQWRKVDATAAKNVLAGASWTLTAQPSGTPITVTDCVAASAASCTGADTDPAGGQFLVRGLTPGGYQLVETKAPVGFVLNSTPIAVTVSATTQTTVLPDVVNQQQTVPVIPLTGGLGTDYLVITGGGLLAVMAGLGLWQFLRRRRLA
ncbi:hypothetical protein ASE16_16490 [Leifsonia sp. Root227]|uniref:DUF7933 domain-containing protein n=1 Tax=Leifsonia sp. Root227 TaxID=1736496 RepID=UPI0006F79533|nr:SpaA isopeptide-forming pilin-related protein [Leifsonia sp. Root227]KRC46981.1 hypothetical protein ASE16_16490 [Leifsonia sp. Root227]